MYTTCRRCFRSISIIFSLLIILSQLGSRIGYKKICTFFFLLQYIACFETNTRIYEKNTKITENFMHCYSEYGLNITGVLRLETTYFMIVLMLYNLLFTFYCIYMRISLSSFMYPKIILYITVIFLCILFVRHFLLDISFCYTFIGTQYF